MKIVFLIFSLGLAITAGAQVKVGDNPAVLKPSAMLEVEASDKGFLPPRMTQAQRDAIVSPEAGLVIYNTTSNCLNYRNTTAWVSLCSIVVTPDNKVTVYNDSASAYTGPLFIYYDLYVFPISTCPLLINGQTATKVLENNRNLCRCNLANVSIPANGTLDLELTAGHSTIAFVPNETRGKIVNTQISALRSFGEADTRLRLGNQLISHFYLNSSSQKDKVTMY